jgi:hypothetical protein
MPPLASNSVNGSVPGECSATTVVESKATHRAVGIYLGIDPGASGGLACLSLDPVDAVPLGNMTPQDVWHWFHFLSGRKDVFAAIEKVHAMPGNGVAGMFRFGVGYGELRMALIAAAIPFEEVTPQKWQNSLSIPKRAKGEEAAPWKRRLKAKAQSLFPDVKVTLATADALLIAEWCRRKRTGTL